MLKIKLFGWGAGFLYCEVADIHHIEPHKVGYEGSTIFLRNMPPDHPGYDIENEEMARIEPLLIGVPAQTPMPLFSERMVNSWRYICNIPLDYKAERADALIGLFDAVDQVARITLSDHEEVNAQED